MCRSCFKGMPSTLYGVNFDTNIGFVTAYLLSKGVHATLAEIGPQFYERLEMDDNTLSNAKQPPHKLHVINTGPEEPPCRRLQANIIQNAHKY